MEELLHGLILLSIPSTLAFSKKQASLDHAVTFLHFK